MKAQKPGTDQECWFKVLATGYELPEFELPTSSTTDQNVVECFIPVSNGDRLTVKGFFSGTVLHGCWDLVVDGSFLGDKRYEGTNGV